MTMSLADSLPDLETARNSRSGKTTGMRIFDWYFSGKKEYQQALPPRAGVNLDQVKAMFEESGASIFGRRTYDNSRMVGRVSIRVNHLPIFVLHSQSPPSRDRPRGRRSSPS